MVAPYYPENFVGPIPPMPLEPEGATFQHGSPGVLVEDGLITIPTTGTDWREYLNGGYIIDSTRNYTAPSTTDTSGVSALPPKPGVIVTKSNWFPLLVIGAVLLFAYRLGGK